MNNNPVLTVEGMNKIINLIDGYIENEEEIEKAIFEFNDAIKNVYESSNSLLLQKNNISIGEAIHTKNDNLNSYKLYIKKSMDLLDDTNQNAEKISNDIDDNFIV